MKVSIKTIAKDSSQIKKVKWWGILILIIIFALIIIDQCFKNYCLYKHGGGYLPKDLSSIPLPSTHTTTSVTLLHPSLTFLELFHISDNSATVGIICFVVEFLIFLFFFFQWMFQRKVVVFNENYGISLLIQKSTWNVVFYWGLMFELLSNSIDRVHAYQIGTKKIYFAVIDWFGILGHGGYSFFNLTDILFLINIFGMLFYYLVSLLFRCNIATRKMNI